MPQSRFITIAVKVILLLIIVNLLWWIRPVFTYLKGFAQEVFVPFIAGFVIAYLLHPLVDSLERRKVPRLIAVLLIYISFLLIIIVGLINAIPMFTRQLIELSDDLPRLTNWYHTWLSEWEHHKYFLPDSIQSGVDRVITQSHEGMAQGISKLANNAKNTLSKVLAYGVIPFIAFYLVKDVKQFRRSIISVIPRTYRRKALVTLWDVHETLGNYIHGQMVVSLIVGGLAYVGYWLIGMPYPFVLAVIVSITNVVPFIGPLIGALPALIIALTISVKMALFVLLVNLTVQIIEGNILSPHIVGRSLRMHPLMIIFALLVGEALGGIIGLIFAVPLFAIGKVLISRIALMMRES